MSAATLALQALVTAALAGLCWTVQLAVYPLFTRLLTALGPADFRAYHASYTRAMGWVAAPLMVTEAVLAAGWVWCAPGLSLAWFGLGAVVAIWALTFLCIVPAHRSLQTTPTAAAAGRLVRLNGLRTALWFVRAVLLGAVLVG